MYINILYWCIKVDKLLALEGKYIYIHLMLSYFSTIEVYDLDTVKSTVIYLRAHTLDCTLSQTSGEYK